MQKSRVLQRRSAIFERLEAPRPDSFNGDATIYEVDSIWTAICVAPPWSTLCSISTNVFNVHELGSNQTITALDFMLDVTESMQPDSLLFKIRQTSNRFWISA
jgi:hypothetical protein